MADWDDEAEQLVQRVDQLPDPNALARALVRAVDRARLAHEAGARAEMLVVIKEELRLTLGRPDRLNNSGERG